MTEPVRMRTGWRRIALVVAGCGLVGMAYLGVILPGIPTTPFLLAALFCFARSSPRLHGWLRHSPVFGRFLRDWETHRGIRRPIKVLAICMVVIVVSCSIAFATIPIWVKWVIGGLAVIGITTISLVPTIADPHLPEQSDSANPLP